MMLRAIAIAATVVLGFSVAGLHAQNAWVSTAPNATAPAGPYSDNSIPVTITPQNGSLCDANGCFVQVCQGGGNQQPCQYYYCTINGCRKISPPQQ